jgi:hypothetical protein
MIKLTCNECGGFLEFSTVISWDSNNHSLYRSQCAQYARKCGLSEIHYEVLPASINFNQKSRFVDELNRKSKQKAREEERLLDEEAWREKLI